MVVRISETSYHHCPKLCGGLLPPPRTPIRYMDTVRYSLLYDTVFCLHQVFFCRGGLLLLMVFMTTVLMSSSQGDKTVLPRECSGRIIKSEIHSLISHKRS
uniref:Ovule protein n=1 Tax=Steinernema glaseri TaxID=37863 RepID=A0A1I8A0Z2_9BILA